MIVAINRRFYDLVFMRSIIIRFGLMILSLLVLFKIAEVNFMQAMCGSKWWLQWTLSSSFLQGCVSTYGAKKAWKQEKDIY